LNKMLKPIGLPFLLLGLASGPAVAQAVSGGQAAQSGSEVRANPYDSSRMVDQYLQQRQINNLPNGQAPKAKAGNLGPSRPATAAELVVGAPVNDNSGEAMAKIDQVDADGVVVSMGGAKVKIPANAFGHNKAGLLLDVTKAQFGEIVAKANGAS
jgi:hypothetical protein